MWIDIKDFVEKYIDYIDVEDWDTFLDIVVDEHDPINNQLYHDLEELFNGAGIVIPAQARRNKFLELLEFYLAVYEAEEEILPICIFLPQYYDCRLGFTELECAKLIEENIETINRKFTLLDEYGSGNPTQYLIIKKED